jgi:hypothetical protein
MPILSEIMMQPDLELLQAIYRIPTVTAYNRLEPRPRSEILKEVFAPKCVMLYGF